MLPLLKWEITAATSLDKGFLASVGEKTPSEVKNPLYSLIICKLYINIQNIPTNTLNYQLYLILNLKIQSII